MTQRRSSGWPPRGPIFNARDGYGRTPLHVAAFARQGDAIRALAGAGADLNLQERDRYDVIAAGAPLDHVNNLHWTAVIESIVLGDGGPRHIATLRALINAGASLSLADRQGQTPLALARARGYGAMVAMLVAAGAR